MLGAIELGTRIAERLDLSREVVVWPAPPIEGGWQVQLSAARQGLELLAGTIRSRLTAGDRLILNMGRCAASLATLPAVVEHFPDAAIVWFDAHGDCNTPAVDGTGIDAYLGGMVVTGAAGAWDSGLGNNVDLRNVVLVGARDLDPPEQERVASGQVRLVPVGDQLGERVATAIDGRSVYIHLDCDVMDPDLVATEYQCPGGLSFGQLAEAFTSLAEHDVLGLEIRNMKPRGRTVAGTNLISCSRPSRQFSGALVLETRFAGAILNEQMATQIGSLLEELRRDSPTVNYRQDVEPRASSTAACPHFGLNSPADVRTGPKASINHD